jgi:hypothetical protein
MKKLIPLLLTISIFGCINNNTLVRNDQSLNNKSKSEDIEWSHMWMVSVNNHELPRVLIIGDSHVERYYPVVAEQLKEKAYCSKFTTSRSMGDPALIEQLKALFFSYRFDVICFNNGLHGVDYTDEEYSSFIPVVYSLFKKNNPDLKLIWVNTTARRIRENTGQFEEHNSGVINRNKAVENFTRENNIPLIDFYSLSINHPEYYENDGIHFNKQGVEDEAKTISSGIIKIIDNLNVN